MSFTFFIKPVLAGLSVGAFCMSYCFPFLATFIASENRTPQRNLFLILYFMLGRFLGYAAFGLIFGFLGETTEIPLFDLDHRPALVLVSSL